LSILDGIAKAVWSYFRRTLDAGTPAPPNGKPLDEIAYRVWTYLTRTASGGGPATISGGSISSAEAFGQPKVEIPLLPDAPALMGAIV